MVFHINRYRVGRAALALLFLTTAGTQASELVLTARGNKDAPFVDQQIVFSGAEGVVFVGSDVDWAAGRSAVAIAAPMVVDGEERLPFFLLPRSVYPDPELGTVFFEGYNGIRRAIGEIQARKVTWKPGVRVEPHAPQGSPLRPPTLEYRLRVTTR